MYKTVLQSAAFSVAQGEKNLQKTKWYIFSGIRLYNLYFFFFSEQQLASKHVQQLLLNRDVESHKLFSQTFFPSIWGCK